MAKAFIGTSSYNPKNNTPVVQEKEFNPTFLDFASKNREQKTISVGIDTGVTTSGTLYIVPPGFSFFITDIEMSITSTSGNSCFLIKNSNAVATRNINTLSLLYCKANQSLVSNKSLTMPIKIKENETILFYAGATAPADSYCSFVIFGFLEPNPSS